MLGLHYAGKYLGRGGQCWVVIVFPVGKSYPKTCGKDTDVYSIILNNWPERNTNTYSCPQMKSDEPP